MVKNLTQGVGATNSIFHRSVWRQKTPLFYPSSKKESVLVEKGPHVRIHAASLKRISLSIPKNRGLLASLWAG